MNLILFNGKATGIGDWRTAILVPDILISKVRNMVLMKRLLD